MQHTNFVLELIVWFLAWFAGMGAYYVLFRPVKLYYHKNMLVNSAWYLCSIFVAFIIFYNEVAPVIFGASANIFFFFFFLPLFLQYFSYRHIFLHEGGGGDLVYKKYFVSKTLEILLQQLLFVAGLYIFGGNAFYFALFFGLVHIPLLFFIERTPALVFILGAPLAGYIFSLLILTFKFGIFYSFSLHVMIYVVMNLLDHKGIISVKPAEI